MSFDDLQPNRSGDDDSFSPDARLPLHQLRRTDALVGQIVLGEYAVLDLLGQGGMAKVYKAKQLSVDRFVAIKTLTTDEPNVVARFAQEVKTHGKLHHHNIVQALDCLVDTERGQTFFVMEYLAGLSLEELIKQKGRVTNERDLHAIATQVCSALDHAHKKGIIHRDLKPGNIILCDEDGEVNAKVVDFGIAKVQEDMQRLTKTGIIVGSPIYMSPEQCMGQELDQRSDVYSFGVLLYELITGRPAYLGNNLIEVMRQHCEPDIMPLAIDGSDATIIGANQLDSILRRALATDPGQRFQTIEDFKEAMQFWYKCVETGETHKEISSAGTRKVGERPKTETRTISSTNERELRDLVAKQQAAQDPNRGGSGFADVLALMDQKGTAERIIISESQLQLSDSLIGRTLFNRYKILDLLGEGGMSLVYRALDATSQEVVAVKTLKFVDAELCARFAREMSIHDTLKHPNIVKAIDCQEAPNGQAFFIMEFLKGVSLEDYIASRGQVDNLSDICSILSQIFNAVEFAHEQGVIHRDLKPENIILLEQRGQLRVKVLDFGIAKIQEDLQRLTKTGIVLGSPAYMSPEQCLGNPIVFASDLYALGVVAYELVTGKLPYIAENEIDMMKAHCDPNRVPTPLKQYRKSIEALNALETIIEKALEKDAGSRYQSVADLKEDFDSWWREASKSDPDAISPFKASRKRRKRSEKPTPAQDPVQSVKQTSAINQLLDEKRKSQEKSFRSHFEAKGPAFDYIRILKPVLLCLVLFAFFGGLWSALTYIEDNKLFARPPQAAQTGADSKDTNATGQKTESQTSENQSASVEDPTADEGTTTSEESASTVPEQPSQSRGSYTIRGPNRYRRH